MRLVRASSYNNDHPEGMQDIPCLGLGALGIDLPEEASVSVPDAEWKWELFLPAFKPADDAVSAGGTTVTLNWTGYLLQPARTCIVVLQTEVHLQNFWKSINARKRKMALLKWRNEKLTSTRCA